MWWTHHVRSTSLKACLMPIRDAFMAGTVADYEELRSHHADRQRKPLLPIEIARAQRLKPDWAASSPPTPKFLGTHAYEAIPISEIAEYIDWTPFFHAWECAVATPKFSLIP